MSTQPLLTIPPVKRGDKISASRENRLITGINDVIRDGIQNLMKVGNRQEFWQSSVMCSAVNTSETTLRKGEPVHIYNAAKNINDPSVASEIVLSIAPLSESTINCAIGVVVTDNVEQYGVCRIVIAGLAMCLVRAREAGAVTQKFCDAEPDTITNALVFSGSGYAQLIWRDDTVEDVTTNHWGIVLIPCGGGNGRLPSVANYGALPTELTYYCFYVTEDDDCVWFWDLTDWLAISHIK